MKSSATRNFHIPLPARLHDRLRAAAKQQHRPATQLAKQAIETWLEEQERLTLHEEIADYAAQAVGSSEDLDEQLEAAGLEHLTDAEPGR
jgi:predicted DNA-binding protein